METPLRRAATPGSAPFEAVQSPEDPSQLPSAAGAAASSAARGELEMRLLLEKAQLLDTLVEQNGCSDGAELGILIAQMRRENREHRLRHLDAAADDDDAPPTADAPPLPLGDDKFPDDILALICSVLGLRELGRLACAARRFTEPTLTEPGGGVGGAKLSPIEEGARLRLAAAVAGGGGSGCGGASGGAAAVRLADETWMRALWRVEYRLQFTSCGPAVVLSEEGALRLRAAGRAAAATRCLGGGHAWAPAPACTHSGAGCLSCSGRGARCACGALRAVAAVTRPCCLSDSFLCLCLRFHFPAAAAAARRHRGDEARRQ
eukprot:COSAG06_NODE_1202_length_10285_cov_57.400648_6_plen_320_part_00